VPEGDTIHKLAARIGPLLVGKSLVRVTTQGLERARLAGQTVTGVEAIGKHLVITTGDGTEIRTHLGMNGRWRRYPPGTDPPVSPGRAVLVLHTESDALACLQAPTVEIADRRAARRGLAVARLGPDVLADDFDPVAAAARARAHDARPVGEILLDQTVAAGIGNVYRSEILFLEGVHPGTALSALSDDQVVGLFRRARALMLPNVARPGMRTTTATRSDAARYHVYGRTGLPCPTCRTAIETAVDAGVRRAFWCPRCQAPIRAA
jgi:endonuclease-8